MNAARTSAFLEGALFVAAFAASVSSWIYWVGVS
jgi:hypothetical protein